MATSRDDEIRRLIKAANEVATMQNHAIVPDAHKLRLLGASEALINEVCLPEPIRLREALRLTHDQVKRLQHRLAYSGGIDPRTLVDEVAAELGSIRGGLSAFVHGEPVDGT
jgi:hypothetical protein